jgi:hypothetical protein
MEGIDEITHKPVRRMSNGSLGKLLGRSADSFDIAGHQRFDYFGPDAEGCTTRGGVQPHPLANLFSLG